MRRPLVAAVLLAAAACGGERGAPALERGAGPGVSELEGATLYARHCAMCHGAAGRGDGVNAPNLEPRPRDHGDRRWASSRSDAALAAAIRDGHGRMPPFGRSLKPHQIADLVSHVRALSKKGTKR